MERASINEGFVRDLVRDQHPELADLEIRPVPSGWDNQLWRLGDELAVRLPMTERAPALLRKEFRWLPELAKRLPLPIPTPQHFSEPTARFPRPWIVARWVPGEPADGAEIRNVYQSVDNLARFLRALHQPAPVDAPTNPGRSVPLPTLTEVFESRLAAVAEAVDVRRVRQVWSQAIAAPHWTGPAVWLHADLHPANALVSDGTISGIVDFGDLCAGDPATDLAAAWKLLPQDAADSFFSSYALTTEAAIHRAKGWAVLSALDLLSIGRAWERGLPGGQPTWGRAGRRILERVFAFA
ncbi:aminoglycoside phosphotransferase family protein [Streptomyces canus]|uniref:aminoglycoside phosphotransferase family protein n=1 Tax=Streptomyces canus TaxID=58343 RepID=UPI002E2AC433|nr:aminoglycoside phosphotransferase family protein [Streptomyces canus]